MRSLTLALLALSLLITGCKNDKIVVPTGTTFVDVAKGGSDGGLGKMKPAAPTQPAK